MQYTAHTCAPTLSTHAHTQHARTHARNHTVVPNSISASRASLLRCTSATPAREAACPPTTTAKARTPANPVVVTAHRLVPCAWCWVRRRTIVRMGSETKPPPRPTQDPNAPARAPVANPFNGRSLIGGEPAPPAPPPTTPLLLSSEDECRRQILRLALLLLLLWLLQGVCGSRRASGSGGGVDREAAAAAWQR